MLKKKKKKKGGGGKSGTVVNVCKEKVSQIASMFYIKLFLSYLIK